MSHPHAQHWRDAYHIAREKLLAMRTKAYWQGKLSDSALATAVAILALTEISRQRHSDEIARGLNWLAKTRNSDGGWGDSPESPSNPSCTTLVAAAIRHSSGHNDDEAMAYMESCGGISATLARYGKDRTFSVPIMAACAIAGLTDWRQVPSLPVELAALPRWTFRLGPMPVVSYALPALIAMGLLAAHKRTDTNPVARRMRKLVQPIVLRRLAAIQPDSGGFLEAAPLTGFVAMSLSAAGLDSEPSAAAVIERARAFLLKSQRSEGAWPIDENLSCWNTSLAMAALGQSDQQAVNWLANCQTSQKNTFTNTAAGGWPWSDLPGGVPDADDSAGAILALSQSPNILENTYLVKRLLKGAAWLLNLQNRDGGWPTFCRGWGKLPFDSSCADITAHTLRALQVINHLPGAPTKGIARSRLRALNYLDRSQGPDGAFLPLWFGSQNSKDRSNPVIGTSRVLRAYSDLGLMDRPAAQLARNFLLSVASPGGGWGANSKCSPNIEESALAITALTCAGEKIGVTDCKIAAGLDFLTDAVKSARLDEPSPVGLYFASLWYSEAIYPVAWSVEAFRLALDTLDML